MGKEGITPEILERIKVFQRTEITEYHVYRRLSQWMKGKNREVLEKIAQDEKRHAGIWRRYTGESLAPDRLMLYWYLPVSYTHLDVYKRQGMKDPRVAAVAGAKEVALSVTAGMLTTVIVLLPVMGSSAVSYTHLDVYKRQGDDRRFFARARRGPGLGSTTLDARKMP